MVRVAYRAFFLDDGGILRRINALYREASLSRRQGEESWSRASVSVKQIDANLLQSGGDFNR